MDDKQKVIVIGSSGVANRELIMAVSKSNLSATGGIELIPSNTPIVDVFPDDVINSNPELFIPFIATPVPQTEEIEDKPYQHNPVKTPWLERHVNRGYKKPR